MDAEGLMTFLTVHRSGGFSSAAERLHRSQPAISRRIAILEEELGAPLFDRGPGGVTLSQAGRVLLGPAERALAALQDAAAAVRAVTREGAGPVRIAIVGTLASTQLALRLKAFGQAHPGVELGVRTATSAQVSELVRLGEAEVGVRYHADASTDVDYQLLGRELLAVACPADHPLAGKQIGRLAELKSERWLAFPDTPARHEFAARHIFAIFMAKGLGEIDWRAVDSLTAQKRLVEAGFGLALVPVSSLAEERAAGSLAVIQVDDLRETQDVVLATRRGGYLSAAAGDLIAELRALYDLSSS